MLVTLFAAPKPFAGATAVIQRNALRSWARLAPDVEIVLCGDELGVREAAEEVGARHVPDVDRTPYGTPLVSSVFARARAEARTRLVAYVNADIVLLRDFVEGIRRVRLRRFLLAGRRWNVELEEPIDFEDAGWEGRLRELVRTRGALDHPNAIDYFVLAKDDPIGDLPPFAVGRPRWDNWLIYNARRQRVPVVDATRAVTAVHQAHDYAHIPEGSPSRERWGGPEMDANLALMGETPVFGLMHATHLLGRRSLRPALHPDRLRRRWHARRDVDGRIERLGRLLEPVLVPALAARRRLRRLMARRYA